MRRRRPEGTQGPMIHAVAGKLTYARHRDRLDPSARYLDGEVALAREIVATVSADDLALITAVVNGEQPRRALGPEPSPEAIRMATETLVDRAGVRWDGGWVPVDGE